MRVKFENEGLRRLYEDPDYRLSGSGPELTKAYRKRMQILFGSKDRRDRYEMKSNRFEKLKGRRQGQHSLRLNDQWRLIVRLDSDREGDKAAVVEIGDYH